MGLETYHKRRRFLKTPEPKGKISKKNLKRFVIHKHQARHLHWDFRLEMDGVLKSWAIPKEPPNLAGVKRLAMQVEDHPVDYINFRGTIPQGQYGAGRVEIWDRGHYSLLDQEKGVLKFKLKGKKLKGDFVLVKVKNPKFKNNVWLFFKARQK